MLPLPTPKVFRSRRGALVWSFWVIVAAVLTVGFGPSASNKAPAAAVAERPTDVTGAPIDEQQVKQLAALLNASQIRPDWGRIP